MNSSQFNELNQDLRQHSVDLLLKKGDEYATDDNRLANFESAAILWSLIKPETLSRNPDAVACFGMMLKHIVSVIDIINSKKQVSHEFAKEKFGDTINYFHLLFSILIDNGTIEVKKK